MNAACLALGAMICQLSPAVIWLQKLVVLVLIATRQVQSGVVARENWQAVMLQHVKIFILEICGFRRYILSYLF